MTFSRGLGALSIAVLLGAVSSCAVADRAPVSHSTASTPDGDDPVAARAGVTYIAMCDTDTLVSKPVNVVLDCTKDVGVLDELTWRQWGEDKAAAEGVYIINDCYPDCETGTDQRYAITAVADQLVEGEGAATYRRITVTTREETDGMIIQQVFHLPGIEPAGEPTRPAPAT